MQPFRGSVLDMSHEAPPSTMLDFAFIFWSLMFEGGHEPSNYFNHHTFLMPQQVCYLRNCACPLLHTQLVEYSKILTICVAATAAGNLVHTVGPVDKTAPAGHTVFQMKGSYEDQEMSKYKALRLKLAPYTV